METNTFREDALIWFKQTHSTKLYEVMREQGMEQRTLDSLTGREIELLYTAVHPQVKELYPGNEAGAFDHLDQSETVDNSSKEGDFLDEQPFYELMQQYRCAPTVSQAAVLGCFHQVKEYIRKETKRLQATNEKLYMLLYNLTPGGSEFTNDPEYCAKYAKDEINSLPKTILPFKQRAEKAESVNQELLEALTPFNKLAFECLHNSNLNKDQTVYAYNKAEITMADLRAVQTAINNAKNNQQ